MSDSKEEGMTLEEAGEEILGSKPYTKCSSCHGRGDLGTPVTGINKEGKTFQKVRWSRCTLCFGKGTLVNYAYHQAAQILGVEIPVQPAPLQRIDRLYRNFLKKI